VLNINYSGAVKASTAYGQAVAARNTRVPALLRRHAPCDRGERSRLLLGLHLNFRKPISFDAPSDPFTVTLAYSARVFGLSSCAIRSPPIENFCGTAKCMCACVCLRREILHIANFPQFVGCWTIGKEVFVSSINRNRFERKVKRR